jgi:hypothetical protein
MICVSSDEEYVKKLLEELWEDKGEKNDMGIEKKLEVMSRRIGMYSEIITRSISVARKTKDKMMGFIGRSNESSFIEGEITEMMREIDMFIECIEECNRSILPHRKY